MMVHTGEARGETISGSRILHNMSAPPRMKISLAPFPVATGAEGLSAEDNQSPQRLQLLAHVDLRTLVTNSLEPELASPHTMRIPEFLAARLVLITRRILGKREATLNGLLRHSLEKLQDEVAANLALIDPTSLGHPTFALVRRKPLPGTATDSPETDPAKALSLAARVAGRTYVARRKPRMASLFKGSGAFWFYGSPGGGTGKEQT